MLYGVEEFVCWNKLICGVEFDFYFVVGCFVEGIDMWFDDVFG